MIATCSAQYHTPLFSGYISVFGSFGSTYPSLRIGRICPILPISSFSSSSQCCSSGSWSRISCVVFPVHSTIGRSGFWCSYFGVSVGSSCIIWLSLVFWLCVSCAGCPASLFSGGVLLPVVRYGSLYFLPPCFGIGVLIFSFYVYNCFLYRLVLLRWF